MLHCGAVVAIALIFIVIVPLSQSSETVDVEGYVYCPHMISPSEEGDNKVSWFDVGAGKDAVKPLPKSVVTEKTNCPRKRQVPFLPMKGATIELYGKNTVLPDDLLAEGVSGEEGHFRVVGVSNYWFWNVNPYLIVMYSCPRPSPGFKTCDYYSKIWIKWEGSYTKKTVLIPGAVYVTVPSMEVARKIAKGAVEGRLAACVNVVPQVTSIYQWQGKLEEDNELLLIIKTKSEQLEALKAHVISNHPYDVPEFIAMPIEYGSEPYLKWIHDNVAGANQQPSGVGDAPTTADHPTNQAT